MINNQRIPRRFFFQRLARGGGHGGHGGHGPKVTLGAVLRGRGRRRGGQSDLPARRGPRAAGTTPSASPPTRLHSGPNCAFMHGGDHEDPHSFVCFSLLPL